MYFKTDGIIIEQGPNYRSFNRVGTRKNYLTCTLDIFLPYTTNFTPTQDNLATSISFWLHINSTKRAGVTLLQKFQNSCSGIPQKLRLPTNILTSHNLNE